MEMLPEEASREESQYRAYVSLEIQQGLDDEARGAVVSHAEVQQRLAKWIVRTERAARR